MELSAPIFNDLYELHLGIFAILPASGHILAFPLSLGPPRSRQKTCTKRCSDHRLSLHYTLKMFGFVFMMSMDCECVSNVKRHMDDACMMWELCSGLLDLWFDYKLSLHYTLKMFGFVFTMPMDCECASNVKTMDACMMRELCNGLLDLWFDYRLSLHHTLKMFGFVFMMSMDCDVCGMLNTHGWCMHDVRIMQWVLGLWFLQLRSIIILAIMAPDLHAYTT